MVLVWPNQKPNWFQGNRLKKVGPVGPRKLVGPTLDPGLVKRLFQLTLLTWGTSGKGKNSKPKPGVVGSIGFRLGSKKTEILTFNSSGPNLSL